MTETTREGGCLCGSVRYRLSGEPKRVGVCHCADCRKASGSAFNFFGIWPMSAYEGTGAVGTYGNRSFCPTCGSRVMAFSPDEVEIMLGSLDQAPSELIPGYELWTPRREHWLLNLPWADQHSGNRDGSGGAD